MVYLLWKPEQTKEFRMVKILLRFSMILDLLNARLRLAAVELKGKPGHTVVFFFFSAISALRCQHRVIRQMGLTQAMTLEASPAERSR